MVVFAIDVGNGFFAGISFCEVDKCKLPLHVTYIVVELALAESLEFLF